MRVIKPVVICAATLLTACGGGGGSDDDAPNLAPSVEETVETGLFWTSPVSNIGYRTDSEAGQTSADGAFSYQIGETITFFIGAVELPSAGASSLVTPLDLAGTEDPSNNQVINIMRLLQTLDRDGNCDNGIEIDSAATDVADTAIDFDVPVAEFELNADVLKLIANGGQNTVVGSLVPEQEALTCLQASLNELNTVENLVGVWRRTGTPGESVLILRDNGLYYYAQAENAGYREAYEAGDDFEYGDWRYTDGQVSFSANVNLQASIGPDGTAFAVTLDDLSSLTLQADEGAASYRRVATNGGGIMGSWLAENITGAPFFVFGDDFTFVSLQTIDDYGNPGFEFGTYTYDQQTLTLMIDYDFGPTLFAENSATESKPANVNGDTLTITWEPGVVIPLSRR